MKNFLFIVFLCLNQFAISQEGPADSAQLPAPVKAAFALKYPDMKPKDWWINNKGEYGTILRKENRKRINIWMKRNGAILLLEEELDPKELPESVRLSAEKHISGTSMKAGKYWKQTKKGRIRYIQHVSDSGNIWMNVYNRHGRYIGKDYYRE